MIQTSIALFIYNRPEKTFQVFEKIRSVKPSKIFIIADGPKNSDDQILCHKAREILNIIDWKCEIYTKISDTNIGCRNAIPLGLDWVFEHVEDCIILEDDTVPQPSFFNFCDQLLDKYREDESIACISGFRNDGPNEFDNESYFFSNYPSIWGWATWKRTWKLYDLSMKEWDQMDQNEWLNSQFDDPFSVNYWKRIFSSMQKGFDTWDYAFIFSCWFHKKLSIRTKVNMISNIGFDASGTHTLNPNELYQSEIIDCKFPLIHPKKIKIDSETEKRIEWVSFSGIDKRRLELIKNKLASKK